MRILIINGSPKSGRSNTYKLACAFTNGIKNVCDADIHEIDVNKLNLSPCLGCFACWNKTPGKCVIKDDMSGVLDEILAADIIIWSFGLYYFNVPSKLKNLIDRQLPLSLPFMVKESESGGHPSRYDMSGKRYVVISTCGFYTTKGNYTSVNAMFDHFLGKGRYETIYCGQGELFRVPALSARTGEYLDYVKTAGEEFVSDGITNETREQLDELLYSKEQFEAMADASWGVEQESGEKAAEDFSFTKQMAALYKTSSYPGKDIVLEMAYTDVGRSYQIVLKKDGYEVLKDNFKEYTTKIETPFTVWKDIAAGKISGTQAMMKKLYSVQGDFDLMLHWDDYFGSTKRKKTPAKKAEGKSTMLLLLIPWISFWVGAPIDIFYGSLSAIAVCALLPLIFAKNRKTIYDYISSSVVIIFSILLFINIPTQIIIPLSYLSFGLMWGLSCLTKIPLTAHYSMNNYNGEAALENPLFMKTNSILTFLWGILYIFTSIWTFFLMESDFSIWTAVINNILPIVMGIFTKWFQNWYPAWYARQK